MEVPGEACESPATVFHGPYQSVFQNAESLDFSSSKKRGCLQETASTEMRLSKLSPSKAIICCPEKECESASLVMQAAVSRIHFHKSLTGSKSDSSLSSSARARADRHRKQRQSRRFPSGALRVGHKGCAAAEVHSRELCRSVTQVWRVVVARAPPPTAASSSISETARELCKAELSVIFGLSYGVQRTGRGGTAPGAAAPLPLKVVVRKSFCLECLC